MASASDEFLAEVLVFMTWCCDRPDISGLPKRTPHRRRSTRMTIRLRHQFRFRGNNMSKPEVRQYPSPPR